MKVSRLLKFHTRDSGGDVNDIWKSLKEGKQAWRLTERFSLGKRWTSIIGNVYT